MELLGIKEIQNRLLGVAVVVNKICDKHDIPLFMIAGTMLGAVRHGGFIPWDDDMDFGVPVEYYDCVIALLEKELPYPYHCLTFENSDTCLVTWIKVEDVETVVMEKSLDLSIDEMPGISIDIFPLVSCNPQTCRHIISTIQHIYRINRIVYMQSTDEKNKWKKDVKKIFKHLFPISSRRLNRLIVEKMKKIPNGEFYNIPMDPNYLDRFFLKEWFVPQKRYNFEGTEFLGATNYDAYLKSLYNDYMQLPPKEKQRVHCEHIYLTLPRN